MKTTFILNGEKRSFDFPINITLADALRTIVGIKSLKCGCERGDCGSCTIIINKKTVKSCLVLAVEVDGQEVTTLEGIMKGKATRLQESFLKNNSFQCGYCAPGMIVAATELLEQNKRPTRHQIQEGLSGNLCRCTGYGPIIEAIAQVSGENQ